MYTMRDSGDSDWRKAHLTSRLHSGQLLITERDISIIMLNWPTVGASDKI
jgi:hypothetical protein